MSDDPRTWRRWARVLSSLVQTPPDELESFARERSSEISEIAAADLAHARNLLLHVAASLQDPGRRDGIRHAVEMLDSWEQGRNMPASTPAPSAPVPASAPASAPLAPPPSPVFMARAPAPIAQSPWSPAPMVNAVQGAAAPPPPIVNAVQGGVAPQPMVNAVQGGVAPQPMVNALQATAAAQPNPSALPALPFKGKRSEPPVPIEHQPSPAMGRTVGYSGGAQRAPTMPFAAVRMPAEPLPMALERYAMLCIERSLWPDHLAQTRTRYGLDEAGEQDIDRRFKDHFAEQPAARQRWLRLCAAYRAQLEGSKPVA